MAGLLGDNWDDPRTLATLQMAAGLLGGGNFGQAASRGLGDYQKSMAVATEQQRRQRELAMQEAEQRQRAQVQAMQMQAAQQEAARLQGIQAAHRDAIDLPGTPGMPGSVNQERLIRGLMQHDPIAAAQLLQPKARKLVTLSPGQQVFDEADPTKPVFSAPEKPEAKPEIVKILGTLHGEGTPAFMDALRQYQVKATTHAPAASTNVSVGGPVFEKEYSKDQGKQFSEVMAGINKTAFAAPSQIRKLERMEALLDGVDGGKLAPVGLEVASWANSIGIKMDPKLGNKEAAQALSRDIAGGFRQPGTGPMTDKDFDNFLMQVPDLSKTAEGRKQITSTMKAAAARDIQLGKMARDYERRNGRLDNGFLDEAAQYIAENPVIGAPMGWKVR